MFRRCSRWPDHNWPGCRRGRSRRCPRSCRPRRSRRDVPVYRVGSFWVYNFWGIFGFFHADTPASCDPANGCTGGTFVGIDYQYWGLILFAICLAGIIYSLRKGEGKAPLALGTALCLLAFYAFTTRMHERYLFPFFLPFLAACGLYRNPV